MNLSVSPCFLFYSFLFFFILLPHLSVKLWTRETMVRRNQCPIRLDTSPKRALLLLFFFFLYEHSHTQIHENTKKNHLHLKGRKTGKWMKMLCVVNARICIESVQWRRRRTPRSDEFSFGFVSYPFDMMMREIFQSVEFKRANKRVRINYIHYIN